MLDQINKELSRILKDIRRQERIRRLLKIKDNHLHAYKAELKKVEAKLEKANKTLQKINTHSPKSAFFNLMGNRSEKLNDAENRFAALKKNHDSLTSEMTKIVQEIHQLRFESEALEPLEKLKDDLIKIKEDFLLKDGNSAFLKIVEEVNHLKLDIKELKEAIRYGTQYQKVLKVFIMRVENSVTWKDLEECTGWARKLLTMSGILETELMDVLNRMDVKITFDPRRLGKFWKKIVHVLQWNYTYEYSQDFSCSRAEKHEASLAKSLYRLRVQLKKSRVKLVEKEARKAKLLEKL